MGIPTIQLGRECISNSLALDFDRIRIRIRIRIRPAVSV